MYIYGGDLKIFSHRDEWGANTYEDIFLTMVTYGRRIPFIIYQKGESGEKWKYWEGMVKFSLR